MLLPTLPARPETLDAFQGPVCLPSPERQNSRACETEDTAKRALWTAGSPRHVQSTRPRQVGAASPPG